MLNNNVREKNPLVHCITNYVTVNDVANILLSVGASPVMADSIEEVEEIATISNALYLNIGTINERTIESMMRAGKKANECGIPIVLDPVGVGASNFRKKCISQILQELKVSVIRGNISEIKCIAFDSMSNRGVDAQQEDLITDDNIESNVKLCKSLSKKIGAVISVSGKLDFVADSKTCYVIKNGHSMMAEITGSGCMLTSVIAAHVASQDNVLNSTATAVIQMGIAGEMAADKMSSDEGNSSYRNHLIDAIGKIETDMITQKAKYEIF